MILNTQQIILLCLLVSFVTSIATGITVVSLMQQTPEPVNQIINRVVERTIETVTQQPVSEIREFITQKPSPAPEKEVVTVVVNQEEQSINAVAKNESSVARLYVNNKNQDFITIGVVLNQSGDILVDKRMVDKRGTYLATYGSKKFLVKSDYASETVDFIILKVRGENPNDFTAVSFGDSNTLQVAQSVISLSGSESTRATVGEIVSLNKTAEGVLRSISTSVNGQNVLNGSVLLNLSGLVVGIKIYTTEDRTVFLPINNLKAQIAPTS